MLGRFNDTCVSPVLTGSEANPNLYYLNIFIAAIWVQPNFDTSFPHHQYFSWDYKQFWVVIKLYFSHQLSRTYKAICGIVLVGLLHYTNMDFKNDDETSNEKAQHDFSCKSSEFSYFLAYHNHFMIRSAISRGRIKALGPKYLQIYKVTLPFDATTVFQRIIKAYSIYDAQMNFPYQGENTNHRPSLYSLTKHDVAVADLPGNMLDLVQEIQTYIVTVIQNLYHIPFSQRIHADRHQPHVLKYDASNERSFRSVPLHHDCCHGK